MKHIKTFETIGSPDLIIAVKSGKLENVKMLLDIAKINVHTTFNVDVNCTDRMGWTPLLWATYYKNRDMIKMLINAGAEMDYKALHHIGGTKRMVDFYDLSVDKDYTKLSKWIEKEYPEFVAAKKYNL